MNVTYTTELADAYTFLTELEAAKHSAYLDTATPQQITIGVGSNIQDAGNAGARVLAIAAVVPESLSDSFTKLDSNGNTVIDQVARTEYAQYRDALDGIIRSGDLTRLNNFVHLNGLTAGEQTQYANLLNYQNLLPTSFTIPNTDAGNTDIRGIYDETVSIYTQKVVRFLEPITSSSALTLNSNEKIALLSLAFNEKSSNPLLLPGGDLFQAIKSGDRVAAWYEIAFRSNAPIEDENKVSTGRRSLGIENRRIKEATKFSLYEPQNASTPADELLAEAKTIYRFLTLKRDDMDAYFQSMSHIDSSGQPKVDGELTPTEIDALLWNPIQTQLDNARKAIVDDLNVKDPNLNLDAAAYLSTDVYLDPGRDSTTGTVDPDHFNLNMTGSDRNDLILGEGGIDFLNGGLGNDALFGGDGFDRLDGGEGNDTLVGGTGNDTIDGGIGSDTYIYNNGDGADVITDAQGLNHIRANGSNLGGLFDGNALYSLESGNVMRWEINGGEHVYEYDATLQTVKISGSALGGANDSITIENVADLADLKSRFAIDLQTPVEAVVTTDNSNPLTSSGNTVTDLTAAIGEQGSGRIGVGLNQPLHAGDKIIIKATSNFDLNLLKLIDGANIIDFTNGEVTLDAQEGQSFLSLGFIQQGELTQDANVVFTASIERTLPDGTTEVVDASNSFNLNITDSVPATDPAQAQTTKDILGDPLIHSATIAPGGQGPDWKVVNAYNHVYVDDGNGNQQLVSYDVDYFLVDADGHPTEGLQQVRDDRLNDSTGNDHIMSGAGNDVIGLGRGGDNIVDAGDGNDVVRVFSTTGNNAINLGAGDDNVYSDSDVNGRLAMNGGSGRDYLGGGLGQDVLEGGAGADFLYGYGGNDRLYADVFGSVADLIAQGAVEQATGLQGEVFDAEDGNDQVFGGAGNDLVAGGDGDDLIVSGGGNDYIAGDWNIASSGGQWKNWSVTENLAVDAYTYNIAGVYTQSDAGTGNDTIYAGAGDDVVKGERGNDTIFLEDGNDKAWAGSGADTVLGGAGDDLINGDNGIEFLAEAEHGDDFLDGGDGNDTIWGMGGSDTLYGGAGNDQLLGDSSDQQTGGNDYLNGEAGDDILLGGGAEDVLIGGDGNDELYGEDSGTADAQHADDYLDGGAGNDILVGGGGDDTLLGGDGNDELDGDMAGLADALYGDDYLDGGLGNDQLVGNGGSDTLIGGEGNDSLHGDASDTPVAVQGDDYLDGGAGDDYLQGYGGNDTLLGGDGADTLFGESGDDVLDGGAGNDYVDGGMGADTLVAGDGNDNVVGGSGDDYLDGGAGDDQLTGGAGNDYISGGAGNDIYFMSAGFGEDRISDSVEYTTSGVRIRNNTVAFNFNFAGSGLVLGLGSLKISFANQPGDVLHIDGFDPDDPINSCPISTFQFNDRVFSLEQFLDIGMDLTGTPYEDFLNGTAMSERINALESNDTVYAGGGNDVVDAGAGDDFVDAGTGNDTVYGMDGNDTLLGGDGVDTLDGGAGNDLLDGGTGRDTMIGGAGDDTYVVNEAWEGIVENAGEGTDTVLSAVDNYLVANVENLTLTGVDNLNGWGNNDNNVLTGNSGNNQLIGYAGNDRLDGGAGADTMTGGTGDDTYVVDSVDDVIQENDGEGIDTVESSISFKLQDTWISPYAGEQLHANKTNVENLTLTGTDNIDGGGSREGNILTGNSGNNELRGWHGDDTLYGGAGDDTLSGGSDADIMYGGTGNDTYIIDVADAIIEQANEGIDTVHVSGGYDYVLAGGGGSIASHAIVRPGATYTLDENVENVVLNNPVGYFLDNFGLRKWKPGVGYVSEQFNDVVTDIGDQGLVGYNVTGNDLDNVITGSIGSNELSGGAGNDTLIAEQVDSSQPFNWQSMGHYAGDVLDGGTGADTMVGGLGDDTYVVDDSGDQVIESANGYRYLRINSPIYPNSFPPASDLGMVYSTDTVNASIDYALGTNVENLNLTGTENLRGTGNSLNNIINGNSGDNVLNGGAGHDTINGGAGADTMSGGRGTDTYYVDNAGDTIVETSGYGSGWDQVNASVSYALSDNVEVLRLTGTDNLDGTDESQTGQNSWIYGNSGNNRLDGGTAGTDFLYGGAGNDTLKGGSGWDTLDGGTGADVMIGGLGGDTYYVDNVGDQVIETSADAGGDTVYANVDYTLGENIESLQLNSIYQDNSTAANGTGNDIGNTIYGNERDNVINGLGGNDYIDGDEGNDTLNGGMGDDYIDGSDGNDLVRGGTGDDEIYGGWDGWSGENADALYGDEGDDYIDGQSGNDYISGGIGNDTLYGGFDGGEGGFDGGEGGALTNDDTIYGGAGDDYIDGQSGNDYISGGEGNDILYGGEDGGFDGGEGGFDGGEGGGQVFTNDDIIDGGAGDDYIYGQSGADILNGDDGDDTIKGGLGDDEIFGGSGDDTLRGGQGDDLIDGGKGIDDIRGGRGDDTIIVDGHYEKVAGVPVLDDCGDPVATEALQWTTDRVTENEWSGWDRVLSSASYVMGDNIEELQLTYDEASISSSNPQMLADLQAFGMDGTGNAQDNDIYGNVLKNRIDGGAGADYMVGGAGDDTYVVDNADDMIVEQAGEGNDTVEASFDYTLEGTNLENLTLLDGALHGRGNADDNIIRGNAAANILEGMAGNDQLYGGAGNDILMGGAGSDRYVFRLGDGADVISDSQGSDTLYVGNDLTTANIEGERVGNDAVIRLSGTTDSITLKDWFLNTEGVNRIEFCDGVAMDRTAIEGLFNQPPVANADTMTAFEDGGIVITPTADLLANDTDPNPNDILSVESIGVSTIGAVLSLVGNEVHYDIGNRFQELKAGSVVYDSFEYTINDGNGATATSIVNVTIVGTNDGPVANVDSGAAIEDAGSVLLTAASLMANDTDVDVGDSMSISSVSATSAAGASVSLVNGDVQYDPGTLFQSLAEGQTTTDTFEYTIIDSAGATSTSTVTMTITGTNDAPIVAADTNAVTEDVVLSATGNVLANDSDIDQGDVLSVANAGVFTGTYGTLTLNSDGSYSYALDNASLGVQSLADGQKVTDSFAYSATDGIDSTPSTLTVSITGTNDAPVVAADTAAVQEDVTLTATGNVLANDHDIDQGDVLSVANAGVFAGSYGTLTLNADGSYVYALDNASMGVQSLAEGQVVSDSFDYQATDGLASTPSTLTVSITGTNDAPVVVADTASVQEDVVLSTTGNVLANDSDIDQGDVLSVASAGTFVGTYGTLILNSDGSYSYQLDNASMGVQSLAEGQIVSESFDYLASDGMAETPSTLTVSITGTNDAPIVAADVAAVQEDVTISAIGNVLANDSDIDQGDVLSVANAGVFTGTYGILTLNADGNYTYALDNASMDVQSLAEGQVVSESFDYVASDGLASTPSTLTVSITGTNDAPIVAADTAAVQEDVTVSATGNVLSNDTDIDQGDVLSVANAGVFVGTYGTLTLNGDGSYTYALDNASMDVQSLAEGQVVAESFDYQATDGLAATPSTLTVSITGTNDAPIVAADVAAVQEDVTISAIGNVLANDHDIDQGDVLSVANAGVFTGTYGTLTLNADGNYTYALDNGSMDVQSLAEGQIVSDSFDYQATDGLASTPSTLTVSITGTNDAPVVVADTASVQEDVVLSTTGNVLANDYDIDQGDVLSVANAGMFVGTYGTLTLNGDGSYSYALDNASMGVQSLAEGQVVSDSFDYQATDGLASTPSTLTVSITGTNDAPIVAADTAAVQEDVTVEATGNVLANDYDIDQGDLLSVANAGVFTGTYGTLTLNADGSYSYALDNASMGVQSLAKGQVVSESFDYLATDGMAETPSTLSVSITGTNDAPVVNIPLSDQEAFEEVPFSYQLPVDAFTDIDQGDVLSYSATMATGDPLPEWLRFDPTTQSFTSDMPDGSAAGVWDLRVTATDQHGASAFSDFTLDVADLIKGTCEEDVLTGSGLRDVIYGFGDDDVIEGLGGRDVLIGGTGIDILKGGAGDDILIAEEPLDLSQLGGAPLLAEPDCCDEEDDDDHDSGHDHGDEHHHELASNSEDEHGDDDCDREHDGDHDHKRGKRDHKEHRRVSGNLLDGGAGNDIIYGGGGSDMLIGGTGDDLIRTGSGSNVIAFNLGDGRDTVVSAAESENTISLGGGINFADLALRQQGNDLILDIGLSDSITFSDWYASAENQGIEKLQIISESIEHGHDDDHHHHKLKHSKLRANVQAVDFGEMVEQFDESGATDRWSIVNAKLDKHLEHSNDDADAVGGAMAGQYALTGTLDAMSAGNIQDVLESSKFGAKPQQMKLEG